MKKNYIFTLDFIYYYIIHPNWVLVFLDEQNEWVNGGKVFVGAMITVVNGIMILLSSISNFRLTMICKEVRQYHISRKWNIVECKEDANKDWILVIMNKYGVLGRSKIH